MARTIADWAADEEARKGLALALSNAYLVEALATLRALNRPCATLTPAQIIPGMDPMDQIALNNALRAGGLNMLEALDRMPQLNNARVRAFTDPSFRNNPGEHVN